MPDTKCCKYHDNLFMAWIDADVEPPTDLNECGMAGMGSVTLCCSKCPLHSWYAKNQPTRKVEYIANIIAEEEE